MTMDAIAESLQATKPFDGYYSRRTDIRVDIHMSVVQRILETVDAARASRGSARQKLHRFAIRLVEMTLNRT